VAGAQDGVMTGVGGEFRDRFWLGSCACQLTDSVEFRVHVADRRDQFLTMPYVA
jgi:hypothetical protein